MVVWLHTDTSKLRSRFFNANVKQWINININCTVEDDSRIECNSFWTLACQFPLMWRNKEVHDANVTRLSAPWFWFTKQAVTFSDLLQYRNKTQIFVRWTLPPAL